MYNIYLDPDVHYNRTLVGKQIYTLLSLRSNVLCKKARVLDAGCGTGEVAYVLARNFLRVTAIDCDKRVIDQAKKIYQAKNIRFLRKDALHTELPDKSFEIVICNQVYQYVSKPEKLLAEIFRVLVPGGICYFGAPTPLNRLITKDANPTRLLRYRELQRLCRQFIIHPSTVEILKTPGAYHYYKLEPFAWVTAAIPKWIWRFIEPWSPTVIWLLEKPKGTSE